MESSLKHEHAMTILLEALRLAPDERTGFRRESCGEDGELYHEVLMALELEERMGRFLMHPVVNLQSVALPFEEGQIISHRFEIVRKVGGGGMGVVYEALDLRKRPSEKFGALQAGKVLLHTVENRAILNPK